MQVGMGTVMWGWDRDMEMGTEIWGWGQQYGDEDAGGDGDSNMGVGTAIRGQ